MKRYGSYKQICFLLLLLFMIPCYAQTNGYMFHSAIRDRAGNLWIATHGSGVYRYNAASGMRTNLTEKDGLCANNISCVFEDKAGNIWFGTEAGVCRYDGRSFTDMTAQAGLGLKHNINCILEDRNGNFWFGTNGHGVCRYNFLTGAVTSFTVEQGLGSNAIQCMLEDQAGNLWFGERAGGVCRYDPLSGRFVKISGDGCLSSQIMDIKEDKAGNIWFVNLYNGVCRYDGKSFTHLTENNGLCNDTITCIYEDRDGNIWFGSDFGNASGRGGICRYNGKSFTHFAAKDGLANTNVWTIAEDHNGNIWVGTRGGLFRYHSPSGRFMDYTHKTTNN